jgi:hypothetical protein
MSPVEPHEPFAQKTERDAIAPGRVWTTAAITAIVIVVATVAANVIRKIDLRGDAGPGARQAIPVPAGAQIGIVEQTPIWDTRRGLDDRVTQEESLRHFGWVDRAHGIARIPVDRAMDLVADPSFDSRAIVLPRQPADSGAPGGT